MIHVLVFIPRKSKFLKQFSVFLSHAKYFRREYYEKNASVYIHWPYCKQRCSYCNFVKFIPRKNTFWSFPHSVIEDGIIHELESSLHLSPIESITSVFFGGGTPSLARPQLIEKILTTIEKNCNIASNIEVTLEANPTALEAKKLQDFKSSGINRLSLGIQSLQDELLIHMNRDHTSEEALECINKANGIFPRNLSVDLIFAFPGQTVEGWEQDLKSVASLSLDHLSLYQLTIERGTALFKQVKSGCLVLPKEDEATAMYEFALDFLAAEGMKRYEVSNFARHYSAECLHNKTIWHGGQYIGVGPGAHSRIVIGSLTSHDADCLPDGAREARINAADPRSWLQEVWTKGNGARRLIPQTQMDMQMEYIATSLRTREGAIEEDWRLFSPSPLSVVFPPCSLDPSFLTLDNGYLRATCKGLNVLDFLLPSLIQRISQHNASI